MKHKKLIAFILAFLPLAASAQEERIDTVIPKFLSNGYFFREMPQLPDGEKSILRLKDKEGNSVVVINVNAAAKIAYPKGHTTRTGSQRRPVPERYQHDGHHARTDTSRRKV